MIQTEHTLFHQILRCIGYLAAFVVPALLVLVPIRFLTKIPSFVFRKLLHILAFGFISLMILAAESWQAASLAALLLAVLIYPVLAALENARWFDRLFVQKSPGEIKRSMLQLFLTFAGLIAVVWGIFGRPQLAAVSILMWGTGDAAAALVGIPYGKHKVRSRFTDGKKSWEGSCAMLLASFLTGLSFMLSVSKTAFPSACLRAGLGALFAAATELFTPSEYDTVTVPLAIAAVLLLLTG